MESKVLGISRTVLPENRVDFNQWCRDLNVSFNYVEDMRNNEGMRRGREIMESIHRGRLSMSDGDGLMGKILRRLNSI